jgi:hypothetical protein
MSALPLIGMMVMAIGVLTIRAITNRFSLSSFHGSRYVHRILLGAMLCLFMSISLFLLARPTAKDFQIGSVLGLAASPFTALFECVWRRRKTVGNRVCYGRRNLQKRFLSVVFVFFVISALLDDTKDVIFREYFYVFVALAVSWFLSSIWSYVDVSIIERRLGSPLIEITEGEPSLENFDLPNSTRS